MRYAFVTLYDFDEGHPSGADLADALSVDGSDFPTDGSATSITKFYRLASPPTASDTFQVRLEVELPDGRAFSAESVPVVFVP